LPSISYLRKNREHEEKFREVKKESAQEKALCRGSKRNSSG